MQNNNIISYHHEVLINDFSFTCFDSTAVLNALSKYRDTTRVDKPVKSISIFKSKKGYDWGETLSQPKEYYQNEVLDITFNLESGRAREFVLYKDGKKIYQGEQWPSEN